MRSLAPPFVGGKVHTELVAAVDARRAELVQQAGTLLREKLTSERAFLEDQLASFRGLAELARQVHAGSLSIEAAIAASPFGPRTPRDAFERALAQLRGDLD